MSERSSRPETWRWGVLVCDECGGIASHDHRREHGHNVSATPIQVAPLVEVERLHAQLVTAHDAIREIAQSESLAEVKAICANGPLATAPGGPKEDECWRLREALASSDRRVDRLEEALRSVVRNDKTVYEYRGRHATNRSGALPPQGQRWHTP